MNNDCNLIFEAYLSKKRVLNEAPIYGPGDLDYTADIENTPGGGYGVGTAAAKEGKTKTEIANRILTAVKTKLFKPAMHTIDGKEYQLYYPGSKMKFRIELEKLIKNELKIGGTAAKYTARVIDNLLNVLRVDVEGGAAASPVQVKQAIDTAVQDKPVSDAGATPPAPTQAAANVFVKDPVVRFIKEFMLIFVELPDEITIAGNKEFYESDELHNEVVEAITRAYDDAKAKDKELVNDFIDSLKHKNSYTPQVEAQAKEGEGTGEAPTVDEYPEGDDVYTAAKQEFGLRQQPVDKGNFSYGD